MSCTQVEPELVAFHFGSVTEELRLEMEAHLIACPDCLAAYLAIKREVETAGADQVPSAAVRERLRSAVACELGLVEPVSRKWSWWERPLAFGFATAALIAAVLVLRLLAASPGSPPRTLTPGHAATIEMSPADPAN